MDNDDFFTDNTADVTYKFECRAVDWLDQMSDYEIFSLEVTINEAVKIDSPPGNSGIDIQTETSDDIDISTTCKSAENDV